MVMRFRPTGLDAWLGITPFGLLSLLHPLPPPEDKCLGPLVPWYHDPMWSSQGKGSGGSAPLSGWVVPEALGSYSQKVLVWELIYIFSCLPASSIPDELHVVLPSQGRWS